MTRNEFINDIDTWWDLIDFCREEDCDVCEDVISDDDLSDYIEEDIENAAHDGMSWQEIRDRLNDLDTSYDYYVNDGYMIYNGLDNDDDFEEFKSNVLDWMDHMANGTRTKKILAVCRKMKTPQIKTAKTLLR